MAWLLEQGEAALDGFLLPGHVCVVTGYREYERFPVPQVVAGFEPDEVLLGLLMLTRQVVEGRAVVENAYPRAVSRDGNPKALALLAEVFEPADVEWRGFPVIPGSGLRLRTPYRQYDAAGPVRHPDRPDPEGDGLHLRPRPERGGLPLRLPPLLPRVHAAFARRPLHGQPRRGLPHLAPVPGRRGLTAPSSPYL